MLNKWNRTKNVIVLGLQWELKIICKTKGINIELIMHEHCHCILSNYQFNYAKLPVIISYRFFLRQNSNMPKACMKHMLWINDELLVLECYYVCSEEEEINCIITFWTDENLI